MAAKHERLITRLNDTERRRLFDIVASGARGELVCVEHSYDRKLQGATRTTGSIIAVASAPTGGSPTVLVVQPVAAGKRAIAIASAHVLRIRAASQPWKSRDDEWRDRVMLGEIIAGPPLKEGER